MGLKCSGNGFAISFYSDAACETAETADDAKPVQIDTYGGCQKAVAPAKGSYKVSAASYISAGAAIALSFVASQF